MSYDILVIGAGPAGYVAGIRAGQLGFKTAVVEKSNLGGMCLNWGCIPTKALIESAKLYSNIKDANKFGIDGIDKKNLSFNWQKALQRADRIIMRLSKGIEILLKKNNVEIIQGTASIESDNCIKVNDKIINAKNIIIATGSKPIQKKYPVPENMIVQIYELYKLKELPNEITLTGGNTTTVEIAQFLSLIGKKVSLVSSENTLVPIADPSLSKFIYDKLKKTGVNIFLNSEISGHYDEGIIIGQRRVPCKLIINAEDRLPVIPEIKIEIENHKGIIKVNEYCQTSIDSIFAIGDINGKHKLAHVASVEAIHAVNFLNGVKNPIDYKMCPLNIYSFPEMAQVGYTEPELIKEKIDYKISEFPLSANSKSIIEGNYEGFVRILSEKKYGEILGVQVVAPHATDMISEAIAIMKLEGTIYELASIVHAHPTTSEVFGEAGLIAVDKAIHI